MRAPWLQGRASPTTSSRAARAAPARPSTAPQRYGSAPPGRPQPKLALGPVHSPLEQEADATADRVMAGVPAPRPAAAADASIQRKCAACAHEDDEPVRRAPLGATPTTKLAAPTAARIEAARSGGVPLDGAARSLLEPRFGRSFADVRVHADGEAASLARALGARAFTVGSDVFFAAGAYRPSERAGQHLLAHELTHVLQQQGGVPQVQRVPDEGGIEDGRYAYSTHCGWIDWGHTDPGLTRNLIGRVREASQRIARREAPVRADVASPALVSEPSCTARYEPDERTSSEIEAPVRNVTEQSSGVIFVQLGGFGVGSADSARFAGEVDSAIGAALLVGAARGVSFSLQVGGFSDCVGREARNAALRRTRSTEIAARVAVTLGSGRVRGARQSSMTVSFRNFGLDQYLASNATRAGRKLNRGVLIVLVPSVAPESVVTPPMTSTAPVLGTMSAVELEATLARSLSEDEVLSVAYSLFRTQSRAFERLQGWTDFIAASSFSEEDLPSNNISFYRAARGFSRAEVESRCAAWSIDRSKQKLDGYTFQTNEDFEPTRLPPGGRWPADFTTIRPAPAELVALTTLRMDTPLVSTVCRRVNGRFVCR